MSDLFPIGTVVKGVDGLLYKVVAHETNHGVTLAVGQRMLKDGSRVNLHGIRIIVSRRHFTQVSEDPK